MPSSQQRRPNAEPNGNGLALMGTNKTFVGATSAAGSNLITNFIIGNGVSSDANHGAAGYPNGEVLEFSDEKDRGSGIIVSAGAGGTTIGGARANVLIRNHVDGILVDSGSWDSDPTGTVIQGNHIGVGGNGTSAFANGEEGVSIGVSDVQVGGTAPGAGNLIANNLTGVALGAHVKDVPILSNSIWANRFGIAETTPEPATPSIKTATVKSGVLTVTSEIQQHTGVAATIQVFSSTSCQDPEGRKLLGTSVATANSSGKSTVPVEVSGAASGAAITVTLTENSSTSEFSNCTTAQ